MPAIKKVRFTNDGREKLEKIVKSGKTEQRMVRRAKIILSAGKGFNDEKVGKECKCSRVTANLWRNRWIEQGFLGLKDAPGRGRKELYGIEKRAEIIAATFKRPKESTHWSARRLAQKVGVSKSTVHQIWKEYHLSPHKQETFKYSTDPALKEKVIDIVGMYINPPEKAIVLCADEKSQIQALERTQPLLPMKECYPECRTHDYYRNGTTTLFAALNIATGEVIGECKNRHRHQEWLSFLKTIEKFYPEGEVHLVLDNYGTHKYPTVKRWLSRRPRFVMHFTPTSASWLNQVETWFSILTRQSIRRGSFASVKILIETIKRFIVSWNKKATPFKWVKTPTEILSKAIA